NMASFTENEERRMVKIVTPTSSSSPPIGKDTELNDFMSSPLCAENRPSWQFEKQAFSHLNHYTSLDMPQPRLSLSMRYQQPPSGLSTASPSSTCFSDQQGGTYSGSTLTMGLGHVPRPFPSQGELSGAASPSHSGGSSEMHDQPKREKQKQKRTRSSSSCLSMHRSRSKSKSSVSLTTNLHNVNKVLLNLE
ncbi:hypothetical protein Ciccas_008106, partial [Cichlidogyrus casuarinus]